jgi:acetoin utilization deacetylase AcuC-like enzyme
VCVCTTDAGPRGEGENLLYEAIQIVDDAAEQVGKWKAAVQKIFDRIVQLKPQLLIICLGLDGLGLDTGVKPAGAGKLSCADYVWAMNLLKSLISRFNTKLLIITEGGYNVNGLSTGPFARTHLEVVSSRHVCLGPLSWWVGSLICLMSDECLVCCMCSSRR